MIRAEKQRHFRRQPVVVTEAQFLDGHRVIFIDNRDDRTGREKAVERIARIRAVHPAVDVSVGEKELSD